VSASVRRAVRPAMPWAERLPGPVRRNDEEMLHRTVLAFLRLALPADAICWHTPNGGLRSKRVAQRLNGMGVLAGFPDLAICWRGKLICIELKTKSGVVSVAQREAHRVLLYCGAEVMTCRSTPEVEAQLREMGMPLRASVA
jgi:hypothetical protein